MGKGNNRVDGRSIHFFLEKERICAACYRAGWRGFCYSGYEEEQKKEILGNESENSWKRISRKPNNVHANALGRQGAARAGSSTQSTAPDMEFKHTSSKRKNKKNQRLKQKGSWRAGLFHLRYKIWGSVKALI